MMTPATLRTLALTAARAYCRTVTAIWACGGSAELAEWLLRDTEAALVVWTDEGGKGEN